MDIKKFCEPNDVREWMRQPFNLNGRTVATNGHILISAPEIEGYEPLDILGLGGLVDVLDSVQAIRKFWPMPTIDYPSKRLCRQCGGVGKATESKCEECDGRGELEFYNDHHYYEVECKSCDGNETTIEPGGDDYCTNCLGSGEQYREDSSIFIKPLWFNPKYVELIDFPETEIAFDSEKGRLIFRYKEFVGAIMSMKPPRFHQPGAA